MKHLPAVKSDSVIQRLQAATTALAEAKTIQEAKVIVDVAAAAEIYAKRQKLSQDAIDFAHSVKIEALRRVGEMLKETPKNVGAVPGKTGSKGKPVLDDTPTLADLGLDKKTSSIAQKLADLPEAEFKQVRDGHETISKAIAAVKTIKPKTPAKPVAVPHPAEAEYAALRDRYDELVEELETLSAYRDNDGVAEMTKLRESLRLATRRRDELMVQVKEMRAQCDHWRKRAEKAERQLEKKVA